MNKQKDNEEEAALMAQIQELKMQAEQKMLMHQQMVQQNSIKQEEFVKLRVKATALRKELT
jgi:hypothetical protein